MPSRRSPRRGIVLLVSLVMLVLFLLLGITFVLTALQWRKGALAYSQSVDQHDEGAELSDSALRDLLRGSPDPISPLHYWNLLNDLYGNDSLRGTVGAPNPAPFGDGTSGSLKLQFVPITISPDSAYSLNSTVAFYAGCIMTMLDGPAAGQSRRIVDYDPITGTFQVERFSGTGPAPGNLVLINGRPFNGAGNGYNPATGMNDAKDATGTPRLYALLPNLVYWDNPNATTGYYLPGGTGAFDVDYTAPDFNHPWLAAAEPNPTLSNQVKPSFHDPALLNYWNVASGGTAGSTANISNDTMRKSMFRPTPVDHPKFTGSNPYFNPLTGPWDVDNDGDGVPDSVWIDIGLPARRAVDGRLYKPLIAYLIRDLDGRVNLNVHGSQEMYQSAYTAAIAPPSTDKFAGNPGTNPSLNRGQGYGPPEINPLYLLGAGDATLAAAKTQMQQLFEGATVGGIAIDGRFSSVTDSATPPAKPGLPGSPDLLNQMMFVHLYGSPNVFGTPHDIFGHGSVLTDLRGAPLFYSMGDSNWNNNAYEQAISYSLSSLSAKDTPFTPSDLEAVLRSYDIDGAAMSRRILGLAPLLSSYRNEVTTLSWDLPVPAIQAPKHLRDTLRLNKERAVHVTDLLRARLIKEAGFTPPLTPVQVTTVITRLNSLLMPGAASGTRTGGVLSPELLAGLKFDINRLFGNGIDENGNGIYDDILEVDARTEYVYPAALVSQISNTGAGGQPRAQFNNVGVDRNNDGDVSVGASAIAADRRAKYDYAKQLYVLLMTLVDQDAVVNNPTIFPEVAPASTALRKELIAQRLAQFAINVVDFRDGDATMTPFEYDVNPFKNGDTTASGTALDVCWNVDGDLTTAEKDSTGANPHPDRRVVWGCEAPSVLLTEGIAFHDVRLRDLSSPNGKTTDATPDGDYDQFALPRGSAFFELYSMANNSIGTIDLGKKDPTGLPVWRLAVSAPQLGGITPVSTTLASKPDSTPLEPGATRDLTNTVTTPSPAVTLERFVWLCNSNPDALVGVSPTTVGTTGTFTQAEANQVFYNRNGGSTQVALVPGQYVVVGPTTRAKNASGTASDTPIGKDNTGNADSPQHILLNTGGFSVNVMNLVGGTSIMPTTGTAIQVPTAIVCAANRPTTWSSAFTPSNIGLNISEPLPKNGAYYPEPADVDNNDNKYAAPLDHPLDGPSSTLGSPSPASLVYATGTTTTLNYRTVFLQRLADPNMAFNYTTNPYITVDFMPVDLTMFNGDAAAFGSAGLATPGTVRFRTRERGEATNMNIWAPAGTASDPASTAAVAGGTAFFNHSLRQPEAALPNKYGESLGYLNNTFTTDFSAPFKQMYTSGDSVTTNNYGDPRTPFPWITWFDRPYVSQYELLQVPSSTPARLNYEFSNQMTNAGDPYTNFAQPFKHLLNAFHTNSRSGAAPYEVQANTGPQLDRLFDYLYVPSKFTETETILNPTAFAGGGVGKGRFHPPFNLLSRFREPGRINLNTVFSQYLFMALGNGGPGPAWANFLASRRGYATTPTDAQFSVLDTNAQPMPSFMGNPFRSGACWDMIPLLGTPTVQLPTPPTWLTRRENDVSLLRPDPVSSGSNPLFASGVTATQYDNAARNSYFRYQPFTRMGNLVTTRSNVFAVWLTVGYFEVEAGTVDAQHPDGYRLAGELGVDTGQVRRHRAFYIIDRTIPVGFENGRDYNTQQTIVLRTQIE